MAVSLCIESEKYTVQRRTYVALGIIYQFTLGNIALGVASVHKKATVLSDREATTRNYTKF